MASIGVGIAAGYWPAQRAAVMEPVEALRHEWCHRGMIERRALS